MFLGLCYEENGYKHKNPFILSKRMAGNATDCLVVVWCKLMARLFNDALGHSHLASWYSGCEFPWPNVQSTRYWSAHHNLSNQVL